MVALVFDGMRKVRDWTDKVSIVATEEVIRGMNEVGPYIRRVSS